MLLTLIVSTCLQLVVRAGFPHVYNGEHFYDIMASPVNTSVADRSGILVLYGPECEQNLHPYQMDLDQHLIYVTHDYIQFRMCTWYEYREDDDLFKKYAKEDGPCLSAYFFKKGNSLDKPTEAWTEVMPLWNWIWSMLMTTVLIQNHLNVRICIVQHPLSSDGPETPLVSVDPGGSIEVITYISYSLKVQDDVSRHVIYSCVIEGFDSSIDVGKTKQVQFDVIMSDVQEKIEYMHLWIWSHAQRYLLNLKQPLVVHNYTDVGYKKLTIPLELHVLLTRFYNKHKDRRHMEDLRKGDGVIQSSGEDKQPTMVSLIEYIMSEMEHIIQPQLEQWCKCKLTRTAIYGIREYYEGNVLHNHVDRVETHVISVILQIDQDLGGNDDWLLEVIDYKGKRQYVLLSAGEMLFYESAKLIHGRPRAFKGRTFANAFMHFAPVSGWDYTLDESERGFVSHVHRIREQLEPLNTDLTRKRKQFQYGARDEL